MIRAEYSTPPRSSQRHQGVWSKQHHEHQNQVPHEDSSANEDMRAKRKEACDWIRSLTGVDLPYEDDLELRTQLRDGALLCSIVNIVCPGSIQKVWDDSDTLRSSSSQRHDNIANFLKSISSMGVPPLCTLSMSDLESDSPEERMRVVSCILWLKRLHEGVNPLTPYSPLSPLASLAPEENDLMYCRDSPGKVLPGKCSFGSPIQPTMGAAAALSNASNLTLATRGKPGSGPMVQARGGINHLMAQCKSMLQEQTHVTSTVTTTTTTFKASSSRGGSGGGGGPAVDAGDFNFEAVGPVLESVLGNLTQEYERRLLLKDQEIVSTKDKIASLSRQLLELQTQITSMQEELAAQQHEAALNARASSVEKVQALQATLADLTAELAEREAQLQQLSLQPESDAQDEMECARMESEMDAIKEMLEGMYKLEEQYKAVQDENKKLYNTVLDLKGAIRVFCRVRPLGATGDGSASCMNVDLENEELAMYESGKGGRKMFKFDRIFDMNSSQEHVYSDAQQLIRSVLDGYNVCIFAYGQTGAGKTHTMSGTNVHDMSGRGINYRALDDLFYLREKRSEEVEYSIRVQMLEIYNETLRDLLSEDQSSGCNRLDILNTQASGCNVPNAVQLEVRSPEDVVAMMERGGRKRHSAGTRMNDRSSRSHQILTVIVDGYNKRTHARSHGCLHLVDLAGSERVSKSEASGERLTEAQHINHSLAALGDVMAALANKDKHIPFRNSKLTHLLADSLSGQAKVMMFMHVSPEASSYMETLSTLKFATRVSEVTLGAAKKNVECSKAIMAEEEAGRLRVELASARGRLEAEQHAREALQAEAEALQAQVEAARRGEMGGTPYHQPPNHLLPHSQQHQHQSTSRSSMSLTMLPKRLSLGTDEAQSMMHLEGTATTPKGATATTPLSARYSGSYASKRPSMTPVAPSSASRGTAPSSANPGSLTTRGDFARRGSQLPSQLPTTRGDLIRRGSQLPSAAAPAASATVPSSTPGVGHGHASTTPPSSFSARPGSIYNTGSSLAKPSSSTTPITRSGSMSMRATGVHTSCSGSASLRSTGVHTSSSGSASMRSTGVHTSTNSYASVPSSGYGKKPGVGTIFGSKGTATGAVGVPLSAGGRRSIGGSWNR